MLILILETWGSFTGILKKVQEGAIGSRSDFTLVFGRGKYLQKKKKNRRAGVTLQKKLMCTLKGEFLEIGFTTGAVQLHILVGEGNKTDKWYWAWKMVKLCAQALPFSKCFQYSTLSCKHLMKTNLLCVCIQYQQTWCRNEKFGSLIICSMTKLWFLKTLNGFFRFLERSI